MCTSGPDYCPICGEPGRHKTIMLNGREVCTAPTEATEERMEHDVTVRGCICKACEAWRGRIRRLRDRWLKTAQVAGFEAYRNFAGDMESELLND